MRSLKKAGALVAALIVLAGLAAGTASALEGGHVGISIEAAQFEYEGNEPVELIGENAEGTKAVWTFPSLKNPNTGRSYPVECATETSRSAMMTATPALTILPSYSECRWVGGLIIKVTTNHCGNSVRITPPGLSGEADLVCPNGQRVSLEFVNNGIVHCKIDVYRHDSSLGSLNYSASGFGTLRLKTSETGMKYTFTTNGSTVSSFCPGTAGTYEDGTYSDDMEMIEGETL